jgi:hypothetical protein
MARFVILRHTMPPSSPRRSHWDLMLEDGPALKTWALDQLPTPEGAVEGERLADHRRAYLDREGPVSGDRGAVSRWDTGDLRWETRTDDQLSCHVAGRHLVGRLRLTRNPEPAQRWRVEFTPD